MSHRAKHRSLYFKARNFSKDVQLSFAPSQFYTTLKPNHAARLPIQITKGSLFFFGEQKAKSYFSFPSIVSNSASPTWSSASGSLCICQIKYSTLLARMEMELDRSSASRSSKFPCYLLSNMGQIPGRTLAKKTRYCSKYCLSGICQQSLVNRPAHFCYIFPRDRLFYCCNHIHLPCKFYLLLPDV